MPHHEHPSLPDLAQALAQGSLSDEQLAEQAIAQHRPENHAYRHFDVQGVRRQARQACELRRAGKAQPLTGIPVSVKDLFGVPGFRTHAGCPQPLPERFEVPGPLIAKLSSQGVIFTGKTHTVQFAFGGLGTNPHFPVPVNPWDKQLRRVPGGSSSGAGVSLCEGSALLAMGTDTAGSVRIPAAMTGNAGLKLTAGRWSTRGIVPLSPTLDTPGMLAGSAAALAYAWSALEPAEAIENTVAQELPLGDLRLAQADEAELWSECSPGVAEAVHAALSALSSEGASIERRPWPEAAQALELFRSSSPAALELGRFLSTELPHCISSLDPNVAARVDLDHRPDELARRVEAHRVLATQAQQACASVDAFVFPTVPISPPTLQELAAPEHYSRCNLLALRNTSVANFLGLCAMTLPVGVDQLGLPVGMQLVAAGGREQRLLSIAVAIERALYSRSTASISRH